MFVCVCGSPTGHPGDMSYPSPPRLTFWSWPCDAWHVSPGHWLMPPDRLRLRDCVQRYASASRCLRIFLYVFEMLHLLNLWEANCTVGNKTTADLSVCYNRIKIKDTLVIAGISRVLLLISQISALFRFSKVAKLLFNCLFLILTATSDAHNKLAFKWIV